MVRDSDFFFDGADGIPREFASEPGVRASEEEFLEAGVPFASACPAESTADRRAPGFFLPRLAVLLFDFAGV